MTTWRWGEGGVLATRPQSHGAQGWEGVQGCRAQGRGPSPVPLDPHLRGWAHLPPLSTPSPGRGGPSASQEQLPRRRGVSHWVLVKLGGWSLQSWLCFWKIRGLRVPGKAAGGKPEPKAGP